MTYKHKYVPGETYAWYNNSDALETTASFNYCGLDLVHADTFIQVVEDVTTLATDIFSGGYRFYTDDFVFPTVEYGCYRFIVLDVSAGENVLYISDPFEVVSSTEGLTYCKFRNGKDILNYNYEGLLTYYNKTHIELFKRKPVRPTTTQGYTLSGGSFKRVRTLLTKSWEFITGWFDEKEHDAMQSMIVHSDLQIAIDGTYEAMNLTQESEYLLEWAENYEFIQASVRLQINDRSSSNKAL
jgi:hypothetical protein